MQENSCPFVLVASDLDGTLFDKNCQITERTKEVIFRLYNEKNVKLVMATGRHYLTVKTQHDSLMRFFEEAHKGLESTSQAQVIPKKQHGFYVISSNGARIDDDQGNLFVQHTMDPMVVKEIYNTFGLPYTNLKRGLSQPGDGTDASFPASPKTENGNALDQGGLNEDAEEFSLERVRVSAYTATQWIITSSFLPDESMLRKFGVLPDVIRFDPEDPKNEGKSVLDFLPVEGVNKICFRSKDRELLHIFERQIMERYPGQAYATFSSNFCLDIGPVEVTKYSALCEIADHLGIRLDQVVSFGDSMNDKEMLQNSGKAFIMDNAQARLKAQLPHCTVIGRNDEDAVAKKLEELFSLE